MKIKYISIEEILNGWNLSVTFHGEFYSKTYFNCSKDEAIRQFNDYVEEQDFENALFNILDFAEDNDD